MNILQKYYKEHINEAGCDEAGRGCLAGPVYGAAVIFPPDYYNKDINDSKKLSEKQRINLCKIIENDAISWAVAEIPNETIDKINILNASILSMQTALSKIRTPISYIIIDGNRFNPFSDIPYSTIVCGDATYITIASASILAKTYRDFRMKELHSEYPNYLWEKNKGYPTNEHYIAIKKYGITPYHRKTFLKNYFIYSLNFE